jgi:hypothetical protein
MKDIVLITDHPTNEKRLNNLLNLILRLILLKLIKFYYYDNYKNKY